MQAKDFFLYEHDQQFPQESQCLKVRAFMNIIEFGSKTLLFYSCKKNERVDLSCLPDDVFDRVVNGLGHTELCREGSAYTGKYVMDSAKARPFMEMLKKDVSAAYPRVNKMIAFFGGLADGDVFRIVSLDAPTMNKQLAVLKTKAIATGENEQVVHNRYLRSWGLLSTRYRHYAFGYDGLKTAVGEGDKKRRVCRFCGRRQPQATYNSVAHAISEGLGNKVLLCNEECDECNNKLSKTESNLIHYLDIRRAMGGVLTKTDGTVPSVDGKGFVIRGNENNQAILYIEKEWLDDRTDITEPFNVRLETEESVTHQGIYKALCKIVIDLLPASEMAHFGETVGWINGSVMDNELPSYLATYGRERVSQPTVDIFLSKSPGEDPYCTAIVHVLDAIFVFIMPEVDVDRAQFKTFESIKRHLAKFADLYGGQWQEEDTSEYTLAYPWSSWTVKPWDPQVQIRPKCDPVFMRYKKEGINGAEGVFPPFDEAGISAPVIKNITFERHSDVPVSLAELHQVSVNFNRMICTLNKVDSTAEFTFSFNFSDSANRLSYFNFSFEASVHLENFDKYIELGEWFCIDYHLRDYLCASVMKAGNEELLKYTRGTDLESISLNKVLNKRIIRQLYYQVPVEADRFLVVKDAQIHNL